MQRVRVGMTGLASVLILVGLASVIYSSASREAPVDAAGASKADVVANMTDGVIPNMAAEKQAPSEPLAEIGVAPSTGSTETVNAAEIARQVEAAKASR